MRIELTTGGGAFNHLRGRVDGEFLHEGQGGIAIHMCLLKVWAHFISADQGKELKQDLNSR